MSVDRIAAVWRSSEHKGSALLLMIAIADIADDYGICWPGYEHLAQKIRMSRMSAIRLVNHCAESGELWKLTRSNQRSNIYALVVEFDEDRLVAAGERAIELGVRPPRGSNMLIPPPQVLAVINRPRKVVSKCYQVVTRCDQVVTPGAPDGNIAMSPDPSLSVITQKEEDLWKDTLDFLANQLPRQTFDQHLRGSIAAQENGGLTVQVRHAASIEWLEGPLHQTVTRAVAHVAGQPLDLAFMATTQTQKGDRP